MGGGKPFPFAIFSWCWERMLWNVDFRNDFCKRFLQKIFASAQKSQLSHWSPLSTAVSRVSLELLLSPSKRVQSVHRVHVATAHCRSPQCLQIKTFRRSCAVDRMCTYLKQVFRWVHRCTLVQCTAHCGHLPVAWVWWVEVVHSGEVVHTGGRWGMHQSSFPETRSCT